MHVQVTGTLCVGTKAIGLSRVQSDTALLTSSVHVFTTIPKNFPLSSSLPSPVARLTMTISRGVSGMLLLLGALAIFVGNHGVEAHFKPFSAHFDNPPACTLGPVKIGTHSDRNSTEIEIMSAGGKPCITRKTFLSSDNTCSGEPYATDTLIADEDCWRLPAPPGVADAPASEYYKIKCNTDGTIHGEHIFFFFFFFLLSVLFFLLRSPSFPSFLVFLNAKA